MATHTAGAAPASVVKLVLLKREDGSGIPAFNQGNYTSDSCNIPPPYDKDGNGKQRNVHTSGCGLCAWVSYLAAAKCLVPVYLSGIFALESPLSPVRDDVRLWYEESNTDTLTHPPVIDPGTFIQYLKNYIDSQTRGDKKKRLELSGEIFNSDPNGALNREKPELAVAINNLVTLSGLGSSNVFIPGALTRWGHPPGTDIPAVTASIDGNCPAVIGVHGTHALGIHKPFDHQVLAVGYLKFSGKTYYVIVDSGFHPNDPYPDLSGMTAPIDKASVLGFTVSDSRTNPIQLISWYQPLTGLEQATGLTAVHLETVSGPPAPKPTRRTRS